MGFKSDIEIAQECTMEPITKIAEKAGIDDKYLEQYGKYKAKIDYNLLKESDAPNGKLILVTAINPTPAGEGKTTTTVGLAMEPITKIAEKAGIDDKYLEQYGKYKAKIDYNLLKESDAPNGKLILVTAINPTPAGEGKTTTTVGLADGMQKLGKKVMVALREPSLGPVFGVKGGAAGGGYAQVVPMEDINLHFTGDFHAIGAANNLLAAMLDNHIYQGNELNIDPRKITWRRCVDNWCSKQLTGSYAG